MSSTKSARTHSAASKLALVMPPRAVSSSAFTSTTNPIAQRMPAFVIQQINRMESALEQYTEDPDDEANLREMSNAATTNRKVQGDLYLRQREAKARYKKSEAAKAEKLRKEQAAIVRAVSHNQRRQEAAAKKKAAAKHDDDDKTDSGAKTGKLGDVNAIPCTHCTSLRRDCRQPAGKPDTENCTNCTKVHTRCTCQEYQPAGLYEATLQASTTAHTAQALAITASQLFNLLLGEMYSNDPDPIPPEVMLYMNKSRRLLNDDSLFCQINNLLPVSLKPEARPSGAVSGGASGTEVVGPSAAPAVSDAAGGPSVDPVVWTADHPPINVL
ncbi:hypothetical protein EW026_g7767 [Hermanssonia centrifuga]|uniref:Uncharacterized protein n=1 Tax=Hermanssonia centrifuga TaxID=98765 RepID=A0A4S4K6R2_9APHY|nr:hypothetical protein EW026_g7767 [Hermanssonia centrifuga]